MTIFVKDDMEDLQKDFRPSGAMDKWTRDIANYSVLKLQQITI